MIIEILLLIFGLVLLIKGSEVFIKAASAIAKIAGVSELVIGLTLVSIGTSIPELASSIAAGIQGSSEIIIGNVVGSNIANIALVIGIGAIVLAIKTRRDMLLRDGYIMLFVTFMFVIIAINGFIGRFEAIVLLLMYVAYILFLFDERKKKKGSSYLIEYLMYFATFRYLSFNGNNGKRDNNNKSKKRWFATRRFLLSFLLLVLGGSGIILGAKILIDNAITIASMIGVSETIIGFSVVAIGTSLPELMVTLIAALKRHGDMAIGNILGSNIANILLIIGASGVLFGLSVSREAIVLMMPFLLFLSILILIFIRTDWEVRRTEGIVLLISYILFMIFLLA